MEQAHALWGLAWSCAARRAPALSIRAWATSLQAQSFLVHTMAINFGIW